MSFFTDLVAQEDDFYEAVVDWPVDDNAKEGVLNEIATTALHFSIARVFRFTSQGRIPNRLRFKIDIQVEESPDEPIVEPKPEFEVVENKLIVP